MSVHWIPKKEIDRTVWISVGQRLGRIGRCNQWWLGDWIRYGEKRWGETYAEAAKVTGYDPRSLANMASIAGSFDTSRRRDNLTWSHHASVVGLDVDEQEAWLDRAAEERLSVSDLRLELRAAQRGIETAETDAADAQLAPEPPLIVCPKCGHEIDFDEE